MTDETCRHHTNALQTSFQFFVLSIVLVLVSSRMCDAFVDSSVKSYQAERTCGYNEICKEEFRKIFRCKCPSYLYCRWEIFCRRKFVLGVTTRRDVISMRKIFSRENFFYCLLMCRTLAKEKLFTKQLISICFLADRMEGDIENNYFLLGR